MLSNIFLVIQPVKDEVMKQELPQLLLNREELKCSAFVLIPNQNLKWKWNPVLLYLLADDDLANMINIHPKFVLKLNFPAGFMWEYIFSYI